MLGRCFVRRLLLGCALAGPLVYPVGARAQTFTPIAGGYDCARFPDGHQEITRATATGYEVLKAGQVRRIYTHESKIIRGRLKKLDKMIEALAADRVNKAKLLKIANKILTKIFAEPEIPEEIPEGELELKILNLHTRLEARLALNATILKLIDDCTAGIDPNEGKGSVVSPTVEAVVVATSREIYGGYRAISEPLLVQFATEPGGFPACVKVTFTDGTVTRHFTGIGDEDRCGTGTLIFEGVPPEECDALIPPGKVGIIRPLATYNFVVLPDRTHEELLEDMRLQVTPLLPTVSFLAFTTNMSRDRMVAQCDDF